MTPESERLPACTSSGFSAGMVRGVVSVSESKRVPPVFTSSTSATWEAAFPVGRIAARAAARIRGEGARIYARTAGVSAMARALVSSCVALVCNRPASWLVTLSSRSVAVARAVRLTPLYAVQENEIATASTRALMSSGSFTRMESGGSRSGVMAMGGA